MGSTTKVELTTVADCQSSLHRLADDTLLYRVVETISGQVQLQQDLKHLEQWAADWGMAFNPFKCYIMSINKGKNRHFMSCVE